MPERRVWARERAGLLLKAATALVAYAASLYQATLFGSDAEVEETIRALRSVERDVLCG